MKDRSVTSQPSVAQEEQDEADGATDTKDPEEPEVEVFEEEDEEELDGSRDILSGINSAFLHKSEVLPCPFHVTSEVTVNESDKAKEDEIASEMVSRDPILDRMRRHSLWTDGNVE